MKILTEICGFYLSENREPVHNSWTKCVGGLYLMAFGPDSYEYVCMLIDLGQIRWVLELASHFCY